jgi:hypothetical protein
MPEGVWRSPGAADAAIAAELARQNAADKASAVHFGNRPARRRIC